MKKIGMCLIGILLIAGCAHMNELPSRCDDVTPGESILCDMANSRGIRIEDVGNAFIVVNAIAIGESWYTREEATDVCMELRGLLDEPISYLAFKTNLIKKVNQYPDLLEVAMSYLAAFNIDTDIRRKDRDLIIEWLDNRIQKLGG